MAVVHKIVLGRPTGGRRGHFPVPRFAPRCLCCDAERADALPYDVGGTHLAAGPITVPLCTACRAHVSRLPALGTLLVGLPAGLGVFLVIAALVIGSAPLLGAALALIAVPIILAVVRDRGRVAAAAQGHHRALAIGAGPGFCVVTTTNPRVRDELLAQGGRPLQRDRDAGAPGRRS